MRVDERNTPEVAPADAAAFDSAELESLLDSLSAQAGGTPGGWDVVATLKESPAETTQLVRRAGVDAGPFVRKVFADEQAGAAYDLVYRAQAAGRRFAHLPLIYDVERVGETAAVVMEYVQGETLEAAVGRLGPSEELAADIGARLCDALSELHECPGGAIVHRDVKPSNIIVAEGRLVLIDLGAARAWRDGAARDTVRLGTPGYAPPEQYGFGQTSVRSDVYAAGQVLAFCLTGKHPQQAGGTTDAGAGLSAAWAAVVRKACAFDPAARYGSAAELGQAIRQAAGGANGPGDAGASTNLDNGTRSPLDAAASPTSTSGRNLFDTSTAPAATSPATHDASTYDAAGWHPPAPAAPASPAAQPSVTVGQVNINLDPNAQVTRTRVVRTAGPAPLPDSPSDVWKNQRSSGLSNALGTVWNVVVVLAWLLLVGVAITIPFDVDVNTAWPAWFKGFSYWLILIPILTAIGYALLDKRRLALRFPQINRLRGWKLALAVIVFVFALLILMVVVGDLAGIPHSGAGTSA